jgi:hypothetical protein
MRLVAITACACIVGADELIPGSPGSRELVYYITTNILPRKQHD